MGFLCEELAGTDETSIHITLQPTPAYFRGKGGTWPEHVEDFTASIMISTGLCLRILRVREIVTNQVSHLRSYSGMKNWPNTKQFFATPCTLLKGARTTHLIGDIQSHLVWVNFSLAPTQNQGDIANFMRGFFHDTSGDLDVLVHSKTISKKEFNYAEGCFC